MFLCCCNQFDGVLSGYSCLCCSRFQEERTRERNCRKKVAYQDYMSHEGRSKIWVLFLFAKWNWTCAGKQDHVFFSVLKANPESTHLNPSTDSSTHRKNSFSRSRTSVGKTYASSTHMLPDTIRTYTYGVAWALSCAVILSPPPLIRQKWITHCSTTAGWQNS